MSEYSEPIQNAIKLYFIAFIMTTLFYTETIIVIYYGMPYNIKKPLMLFVSALYLMTTVFVIGVRWYYLRSYLKIVLIEEEVIK